MKTLTINSLSELPEVAAEVVGSLEGRSVVAFCGAMGAGKTTLISAIMEHLGSHDTVTSPTFALVNQYTDGRGEPVYHFDFYRINSLAEAFDLGYEEYFYSGHLCLVEWAERIGELIPDDAMVVRIGVPDPSSRRFEIE